MTSTPDIIFYILAFIAIYAQIFLLITFFENRKVFLKKTEKIKLKKYPAVTIIVPCWNEEQTVYKTVRSVFNLNYPKNKIKLILVDDGSTDNTWKVLSRFAKYPNVKVLKKENGGKHTALNLGLLHTETEFLGCLDADSVADPESLIRLMAYFEKEPEFMAVTPSIVVKETKNIIERAQKAEYLMAVYVKKMLGCLGAIHVTPGPLTIFRKKVFEDLGPYRHAHNTEDMEIAYRMQENHYPIGQCHDALVYTATPPSVKKLYKQRLRWIYGFLNNTLDYRRLMFKKNYGNFALFTLPTGILSTLTAGYVFGRLVFEMFNFLADKFFHYQVTGFDFSFKLNNFDPFFINTELSLFLGFLIYFLVVFSVLLGYKIVKAKGFLSLDLFYFFFIFSLVSPFWLGKAVYNTILSRKPAWR